MTIEDEKRYCVVDHAAKEADQRRAGPSLTSLRRARHRQWDSTDPSVEIDLRAARDAADDGGTAED